MLARVGWADVPPPADAWAGTTLDGTRIVLGKAPGGWRASHAAAPPLHVVVAGRFANRAALVDDLGAAAERAPLDDAEVLLRLWRDRDSACLTVLRGAFALAVWDAQRGRLVIARDQLGLMPCYVTGERGRLAASPSLRALLALPGISDAWDAAALDALLTLGCVPPPATPYVAVRQLRPGDLLAWEDGRNARRRWWQLQVPSRRTARGDVTGAVRERLAEAVRSRYRSGAVLLASGGLGTAALLAGATAERRLPSRLLTVTTVAHGRDEARGAARLAAAVGVPHAVVGDAPDWLDALERALDVHGAPLAPLAAPLLGAAIAASDASVVVAGSGAEDVLGGGPAHRAWTALLRYRALPGPVRELVEIAARVLPLTRTRGLIATAPQGPLSCMRRVASTLSAAQRAALYTPEAFAVVGERGGDDVLGDLLGEAVAAGADDPLDALHHVGLQLRLPLFAALAVDAAGRGVELRLPLLDPRLAHVALAVPPSRRGTAAARAALLAPSLGRRLARAVAARPHRDPVPTVVAWRRGALHALLDEVLSPDRVAAVGVFRTEAIARLRREHTSGRADHAARLWTLALANRWLERAGWPAMRATG